MPATHTDARPRKSTSKATPDAIALLKADHREVEGWFDDFEKTKSESKKQKLAYQICLALTVHAEIEEEIFYPACREAGVEEDTMDEADVEHDGAKKLIAEIEMYDLASWRVVKIWLISRWVSVVNGPRRR